LSIRRVCPFTASPCDIRQGLISLQRATFVLRGQSSRRRVAHLTVSWYCADAMPPPRTLAPTSAQPHLALQGPRMRNRFVCVAIRCARSPSGEMCPFQEQDADVLCEAMGAMANYQLFRDPDDGRKNDGGLVSSNDRPTGALAHLLCPRLCALQSSTRFWPVTECTVE